MTQPSPEMLSFAAFVDYICRELEVEDLTVKPSTNFMEDLGFDSVRMLELSIVIEELGVELDDEDLESLITGQGAYDAYVKQARHS